MFYINFFNPIIQFIFTALYIDKFSFNVNSLRFFACGLILLRNLLNLEKCCAINDWLNCFRFLVYIKYILGHKRLTKMIFQLFNYVTYMDMKVPLITNLTYIKY